MAQPNTDRSPDGHLRGFTLIELCAVVAMMGIVATLGMAGMREMVLAERARNAAVKFSTDLRRHRSEAIQRQMFAYVETAAGVDGSVVVRFLAKREGTLTTNPCEEMAAGTSDISSTHVYETQVAVTEVDPVAGTSITTNQICFTQLGSPRTIDLSGARAIDIALSNGGNTSFSLSIDPVGAMNSSEAAASTGIASTANHPLDIMRGESAPVQPNVLDAEAAPFYEIDPGVFIEAGGDGDDSGTGINACDPYYGVCPSDCVVNMCASPCNTCYNPCSDAGYFAANQCECDPCSCDACCMDPCSCDPCCVNPLDPLCVPAPAP